jgi:hypothetical protein
MICCERERTGRGLRWLFGPWVMAFIVGFLPMRSEAALTIFFDQGRTLQADRTQVIGSRVRVETPTESLEFPSSAVLSIHRVSPPTASSSSPPPADVYPNLTQQMTDTVRSEIQEQGALQGK